jgi:hypothetical protein
VSRPPLDAGASDTSKMPAPEELKKKQAHGIDVDDADDDGDE